MKNKRNTITERFINSVTKRLSENLQVRRSLPDGGRLHIDRQLPFLCIYRKDPSSDRVDTQRLITGEASYLIASASRVSKKNISNLVSRISEVLSKKFGAFLIIEIWENSGSGSNEVTPPENKPCFRVFCNRNFSSSSSVSTLMTALKDIKIRKISAEAELIHSQKTTPPGLSGFISPAEAVSNGVHSIGIEINPVYYNRDSGNFFPFDFRALHRGLARALKRSFFQFARNQTNLHPKHYHSLGRLKMVKAVSEVDNQLADINNSFDFLLLITPVNNNSAWLDFKRNKFDKSPAFVYRPLPIDPEIIKRKLYSIPVEQVEDPTLEQLFRDQQRELDRKLSMLIDRGTKKFRYGNLLLYSDVKEPLVKTALEILRKIPPRSRDESLKRSISAEEFALRAEKEIEYFRRTVPDIRSKVYIRDDITGLMVSRGNLLIGKNLRVPSERTEALIQHEVGTHILTYVNGEAQPFKQLSSGLPGYEELQEGLAVFSEYLVGGLSRPRLRLLAARVIAARNMLDGASFVDVFRDLTNEHNFNRTAAFNISMRTLRSGGSIKDHIYLKGFINLMEYIKIGGDFEQLLVGKIGVAHIGLIKELRWRKVLKPTMLKPGYIDQPQTREKLEKIKNGITLFDMVKGRKK